MVEIASINSYMNSSNNKVEAPKNNTLSRKDSDFAKTLKSTKEDSKNIDSVATSRNEDVNTTLEENSDNVKISKTDKTDILEDTDKAPDTSSDTNNDISDLLSMLLALSGNSEVKVQLNNALKSNDLKTVNEIVSKLLNGVTDASSSKDNSSILSAFKNLESDISLSGNAQNKGNTFSDSLNELVSNISNKLVSDESLKTNIINMLQNMQDGTTVGETANLKNAIINKLTQLADAESKTIREENRLISDFGKEDILMLSKNNNGTDSSKQPELKYTVSSSEVIKSVQKSEPKEDKLLKNLIGEKNDSSKTSLNDKIANVVTRFENIKLDKAPIAQEQPVISKSTIDTDFIKTIKFMDANNLKEMSVKIIPRDLGEIVIRLTMDNGVMKANITAQNKDTYSLLNSQLPAISNQLAEQNMTIQSFSLSLGSGESFMSNGNANQGNEGNNQNRQASKVLGIEEDNGTEGYGLEENTVNILA